MDDQAMYSFLLNPAPMIIKIPVTFKKPESFVFVVVIVKTF